MSEKEKKTIDLLISDIQSVKVLRAKDEYSSVIKLLCGIVHEPEYSFIFSNNSQ